MSYLPYEIIQESVTITRDGPKAEVTVLVPWEDAISFGKACVGGVQSYGGLLQYFTPTAYGGSGLFILCNQAQIDPVGDFGDTTWITAKVKLSFGKDDQPEDEQENQDPTQIADFTYDLSAQELTIPKTGVWLDGGSASDTLPEDFPNPIKIVPEGSLTASFKFKPQHDISNWISYMGKVNAAEFKGHPAETVLFAGVQTKRTRTTDGVDAWEYAVNFLAKYGGATWNKIWKPEDADWVGLNPAQYETADFDELLNNL